MLSKENILKALGCRDLKSLRAASEFYYSVSGVYQRVCDYAANIYRFDWFLTPEVENDYNEDKVLKQFKKILTYLDNSYIKKLCGDIALSVIIKGCYYGVLVPADDRILLQELPINYCRSLYNISGCPAVEFNMKYFDENFTDTTYRNRVLKMFPVDFQKGYELYRQGKLGVGIDGSPSGWYLLEAGSAIKFSLNNTDIPLFVNAIPSILDLDAAQDLDRQKQMQRLLKIIVQKLPLDKNGDLIFDIDEARDIHANAVDMLRRAIGVDVLTTFADIESIDLSDKNTATSVDDIEKVERTVYNNTGTSRNLYNATGNLSMSYSILDDESTLRTLLLQFQIFFDRIVQRQVNNKKVNFRLYMLETTQYNYKDISKMYKEQVQVGYSKMLPQIALGHSQSSILNTAFFENRILHLSELMIPPLMSSSIGSEDVQALSAGRPEKEETEKSDKTLQNLESMN